jgi:hypothetical protein
MSKPRDNEPDQTREQVLARSDPSGDGATQWKALYKEAMGEVNREKVDDRVTSALNEISRRTMELGHHAESLEERHEMADAVASLKSWQKLNKHR